VYPNQIKREDIMTSSGQAATPALQELLKDAALAGSWTLDSSKSTVGLKSKSMWGLVPVKGVFREVTGEGTVSPAGQVAGRVAVAAASVDTKNKRRDTHLRSADFFDSDNYPDITFTAEGVRLSGPSDPAVTVTGTLSVRDRTRPLTFGATAAVQDNGEVWLDAQVGINRADFGLTWNRLGLVGTDNIIKVHAVFTRR
jgi:polyisoprenoid-binding protein YceI